MKSSVDLVFNSLRIPVPELKAVILIHASGEFQSAASPDFQYDAELFAAEYAALFRIAHRTAEDTAMGDAFEQILISSKATLLVRRFGPADIAVFVCDPGQQLGRLRYEIRRLAEQSAVA